eukprot:CAMPEP_0171827346 /NCGR_PEP_ID=MMETSP0992-20121227/6589_1 /TAXON_ID=483369 /ORGANISM="non described non described, Strain CCMP2098" /LENGTH=402 /DNA_ID=CAMNT_0012442473 /DNA_START=363 /DNA_END=1568 /DNA_ORIENTATION=-
MSDIISALDVPRPPLKSGDRGESVVKLNRCLSALGLLPSLQDMVLDDVFTPATRDAMITFQFRHLHTVDRAMTDRLGDYGEETAATLAREFKSKDSGSGDDSGSRGGVVSLIAGDLQVSSQCVAKSRREAAADLQLSWNEGMTQAVDLRSTAGSASRVSGSCHAADTENSPPFPTARIRFHPLKHRKMSTLQKEGHPDPTLGDYNGRTPLELAVDFGRSRLEVAEAIARYASHVYACNVSTVLASADRTLVSDSLDGEGHADDKEGRGGGGVGRGGGMMEQDGQASPEQAATLKRLLLVPHSSSPPSPLACNDVASSAVVGGWGGGARDADDAVLLEAHRRYTEEAPHDVEKLVQSLLLRADTAIAEHASDAPASLSSSSSSLAAPTSAPSAPNPFRVLPAL